MEKFSTMQLSTKKIILLGAALSVLVILLVLDIFLFRREISNFFGQNRTTNRPACFSGPFRHGFATLDFLFSQYPSLVEKSYPTFSFIIEGQIKSFSQEELLILVENKEMRFNKRNLQGKIDYLEKAIPGENARHITQKEIRSGDRVNVFSAVNPFSGDLQVEVIMLTNKQP